jgi:hypothetical protein
MGVSNQIAIKRSVRASDVQKKIKAAALGRNAELEAENIVVSHRWSQDHAQRQGR